MFRFSVGLAIWIVALLAGGYVLVGLANDSRQSWGGMWTFICCQRQRVDIELERPLPLAIGDPVIVYENGQALVVGRVSHVNHPQANRSNANLADRGRIELFSFTPPVRARDYLSHHQTPDSMDWLVQMMLPPHKRSQIGQLIVEAYREHQTEILAVLQPIVINSIREANEIIREELYQSITRREEQIRRLGMRYQVELVERELLPLIREVIWPIVQEETGPVATTIGEEIWEKASVWRFGWRIMYDRLPLPERNLAPKEFQRFMEQHGRPIIESHLTDILESQQSILIRISENEQVRKVLAATGRQILKDQEFQQLSADILRDVFVNSQRLATAIGDHWNNDEARQALEWTNHKLEPTITRIGQSLFGSPEESITPEFSRILRNRILNKDDRWLVLHRATGSDSQTKPAAKLYVISGSTGTENPFHVPAEPRF